MDDFSKEGEVGSWLDQLEIPKNAPDGLGRELFARTLVDALVKMPNDRSVVTAVFGPWGCGKTWLLERVVEFLERDYPSAVDVCRFAPWELKSDEQILSEFFSVVSGKIPKEKDAENLAALWQKLEQYTLIGSLGVGGVASAIQLGGGIDEAGVAAKVVIQSMFGSFSKLFSIAAKSSKTNGKKESRKTLSEVKNELAGELRQKLPRPIVIVIDDLDRLTDAEIQLMIRLLNTTANLPQLHYLIFGDRMQIASALNPICGGQGDRYLEKLVQNSFQVPEPGENQIRLRLWDGLEKISSDIGESMSEHGKRFSSFWDAFLKFRIRNFRDCHRLLRTFSFHVGALTREKVLEVDLMDLLAIDFLRVFDPGSYHRIASEIPTNLWCFANLSLKEDGDDAKRLIELVKESTLGNRVFCGALISIFPHLGSYMQKFLDENQLRSLRYGRSNDKPSPLGICNFDRSEIYFKLDVSAGDLPEVKVKEFSSNLNDVIQTTKLLEDYGRRGWLVQLFGRLRSDLGLVKDGASAAKLLLAVSSISDDLKSERGLEDDELRGAARLADDLIILMGKSNMQKEILPAISSAGGVSLALLLIEQMRSASSCAFFKGAQAPQGILQLTPREIEDITDKIFPEVQKKFWQESFMKQTHDASRAYRMAHALGPIRTEKLLIYAKNGASPECVWRVLESIAISIMPSIGVNSWDDPALEQVEESELLNHLLRFASLDFWSEFLFSAERGDVSAFSEKLVKHLESPIALKKAKEADGPENKL